MDPSPFLIQRIFNLKIVQFIQLGDALVAKFTYNQCKPKIPKSFNLTPFLEVMVGRTSLDGEGG